MLRLCKFAWVYLFTFYVASEVGADAAGDVGKLLGGELLLRVGEEQVALLLQGDKVDVSVGDLHAQHGYADTLAGHKPLWQKNIND